MSKLAALCASVALAACTTPDDTDPPIPPDQPPGMPIGVEMKAASEILAGISARDTQNFGNSTGVHSCSYRYSHYEAEQNGTQLHVVGAYEATAGNEITVHVTRAGDSVLWLGGYESINWVVTAAPGANIQEIILGGFNVQTASAPAGVTVRTLPESSMPLGMYWPSHRSTDMVEAAEFYTNLSLTSFRGCYDSTGFEIADPGAISPPHPVSTEAKPTPIPGCDAIAAESNYCLAMREFGLDGVTMLGLDSASSCGAVNIPVDITGLSTLGWRGDYVYTCSYERGIVRTSLIDGSTDVAPVPCEAVTTYDGGLLALAPAQYFVPGSSIAWLGLVQFATFEDAAARRATKVFELDPFASRLAVASNGRAYFSWHSTDRVESAALQDGATITSTVLEGYDDWIQGIEVLDDGRMLIGASWSADETLMVFDADTGSQLESLTIPGLNSIAGLSCVSN